MAPQGSTSVVKAFKGFLNKLGSRKDSKAQKASTGHSFASAPVAEPAASKGAEPRITPAALSARVPEPQVNNPSGRPASTTAAVGPVLHRSDGPVAVTPVAVTSSRDSPAVKGESPHGTLGNSSAQNLQHHKLLAALESVDRGQSGSTRTSYAVPDLTGVLFAQQTNASGAVGRLTTNLHGAAQGQSGEHPYVGLASAIGPGGANIGPGADETNPSGNLSRTFASMQLHGPHGALQQGLGVPYSSYSAAQNTMTNDAVVAVNSATQNLHDMLLGEYDMVESGHQATGRVLHAEGSPRREAAGQVSPKAVGGSPLGPRSLQSPLQGNSGGLLPRQQHAVESLAAAGEQSLTSLGGIKEETPGELGKLQQGGQQEVGEDGGSVPLVLGPGPAQQRESGASSAAAAGQQQVQAQGSTAGLEAAPASAPAPGPRDAGVPSAEAPSAAVEIVAGVSGTGAAESTSPGLAAAAAAAAAPGISRDPTPERTSSMPAPTAPSAVASTEPSTRPAADALTESAAPAPAGAPALPAPNHKQPDAITVPTVKAQPTSQPLADAPPPSPPPPLPSAAAAAPAIPAQAAVPITYSYLGPQPAPLGRPMRLTTACLGAHTTLCDSAGDQSFQRALQRKMQLVYRWLQASDLTAAPDPRLEVPLSEYAVANESKAEPAPPPVEGSAKAAGQGGAVEGMGVAGGAGGHWVGTAGDSEGARRGAGAAGPTGRDGGGPAGGNGAVQAPLDAKRAAAAFASMGLDASGGSGGGGSAARRAAGGSRKIVAGPLGVDGSALGAAAATETTAGGKGADAEASTSDMAPPLVTSALRTEHLPPSGPVEGGYTRHVQQWLDQHVPSQPTNVIVQHQVQVGSRGPRFQQVSSPLPQVQLPRVARPEPRGSPPARPDRQPQQKEQEQLPHASGQHVAEPTNLQHKSQQQQQQIASYPVDGSGEGTTPGGSGQNQGCTEGSGAPGGSGGAGERGSPRGVGQPGPTTVAPADRSVAPEPHGEYGAQEAHVGESAANGGRGLQPVDGAAAVGAVVRPMIQAQESQHLQHSLSDLYAGGQAVEGTNLPPRVLANGDEAFAGQKAQAAAAGLGAGALYPMALGGALAGAAGAPSMGLGVQGLDGRDSAVGPRPGSSVPPSRTKTIAVASHCPPELLPQPPTAPWTIDDFTLLKKLYEGSLSVVCQAQHRRSGRHVALKIYKRSRLHEMERFQLAREICLHIRIVHPHVVALYVAWKDSKYVYLALEWAPQGNMFDFLVSRGGRLSEQEAARVVMRPLMSALAFLHSQHFIHRDIKLENLLLDASCNLKLADFGLAIDQKFEKANTRLGTFGYFAPEVLDCPLKKGPFDLKDASVPGYDCRVDVWSAGVVGCEVLTGRAPFSASSPAKIIQAIRTRVLDFPNLSPEAADFLHSALTRDPATRPSAKQLLSHPWIVRHCGGLTGGSTGSPTALHLPAPPLPPPPAAPQLPADAPAAGPTGVWQSEGADGGSGSPVQQAVGATQLQKQQLEQQQQQQQAAEPASGQSWHQSGDGGAGGSGEHRGPMGQTVSQSPSH